MDIKKCDLCKKIIKEQPIVAWVGYSDKVELCEKCGEPIRKFFIKNKFIKKDKKNARK